MMCDRVKEVVWVPDQSTKLKHFRPLKESCHLIKTAGWTLFFKQNIFATVLQ